MQTLDIDQFVINTDSDTFTYLLRDDTFDVINGFEKRAYELGIVFSDEVCQQLHFAYQDFIKGLIVSYQANSGDRNTKLEIVESSIVNRLRNEKIAAFIEASEHNCVVVTMDPLCDFPDTIPFAVSRLFDHGGLISEKLTNRPGSLLIHEQIDAIRAAAKGNAIILVEDDLFSGSTISRTMALLRGDDANGADFEIKVEALFPGIQVVNDQPLSFGNDIHVDPVYSVCIPQGCETDSVLDIGDPRDFLVGGDGLVTEVGRMPYVRPFISPSARASVPNHNEDHFSGEVLELTKEFYRKAEEITGVKWTAQFCEPAAQDGLFHHNFVDTHDIANKSMVDVITHVCVHHLLTRSVPPRIIDQPSLPAITNN